MTKEFREKSIIGKLDSLYQYTSVSINIFISCHHPVYIILINMQYWHTMNMMTHSIIAQIYRPFWILYDLDDSFIIWSTIEHDPKSLVNTGWEYLMMVLMKAGGHVGGTWGTFHLTFEHLSTYKFQIHTHSFILDISYYFCCRC